MDFRPVHIFIDSGACTWGDGTTFTEDDATIKPNIKFDWAVDGTTKNIKNASSTDLQYNPNPAGGFPTLPIRHVTSSGNSTYLDPATANSGNSLVSATTRPSVNTTTGRLSWGSSNPFNFFFVGLNKTPKASNGTDATDTTNWTDAVYYELVLDAYAPDLSKQNNYLHISCEINENLSKGYNNRYNWGLGCTLLTESGAFKNMSPFGAGMGLYFPNGKLFTNRLVNNGTSLYMASNNTVDNASNNLTAFQAGDRIAFEMNDGGYACTLYKQDGTTEFQKIRNTNALKNEADLLILPALNSLGRVGQRVVSVRYPKLKTTRY